MHDRWLVGYAAQDAEQGRYALARHTTGDIAVFDSRQAAQCWADWFEARSTTDCPVRDTVLIKLPPGPYSSGTSYISLTPAGIPPGTSKDPG